MVTLGEYAARLGGTVLGDPATPIERISAIDDVDETTLTFATDERYLRNALASRAAAVLTEARLAARAPDPRKPLLLVESARAALAALLADLEPPRCAGPYRHPSAIVDASATIERDVYIGALAIVAARARIGAESVLMAGVTIGEDARAGQRCTFHPRAMLLDRCVAGDRVVLQPGAVIGSDGFGYAFFDGRFAKIPQIGNVVLGDDVEIGANTCVDRAQTGSTTIGEGTKIDNQVQIGHNVTIGRHCLLAAQIGLAGSLTIGDNVALGAKVGINNHLHIGDGAQVTAMSAVKDDIPANGRWGGYFAKPTKQWFREIVAVERLVRDSATNPKGEGRE